MSGKPYRGISRSKLKLWNKRTRDRIRRHEKFMASKPYIHVPKKPPTRTPQVDWWD